MEIIQGGVTAAKGFKAAGMNAGIKNKTKKDMAMIFSEKPCVTAGTFTTNKVFAAPVKWDKNIVYNSEYSQAVVINSGVANACTGEEGDNACLREAQAVSKAHAAHCNFLSFYVNCHGNLLRSCIGCHNCICSLCSRFLCISKH